MSVLELIFTILGSAGVSAVLVKVLHRRVDVATAEKIRAEARKIAAESVTHEVDMLRRILDDFRIAGARKDERIEQLELRTAKLEERERHMLTRAAVHEAWDQMAFAAIVTRDASFPPPPPLSHDRGITAGATEPDDVRDHS